MVFDSEEDTLVSLPLSKKSKFSASLTKSTKELRIFGWKRILFYIH